MTDLRHHHNTALRLAVDFARDAASTANPVDFASALRNAMSMLDDVPLSIVLPEAPESDKTHGDLRRCA